MKNLKSAFLSLLVTFLMFYFLAELNIEKINIHNLHKPKTRVYKVFKPKRITQKKKIVKRIKPKKQIEKPKIIEKEKLAKKIKAKEINQKVPTPQIVEEIIEYDDITQEAVIIERVVPKYPDIASKAGIECTLLVEIIVNEKGRVEHAQITHSSEQGYGFEKSAIQATKKLRFKPFLVNDEPVKVRIIYPIDFILIR
jgi:TonB family protein